MVDFPSPRISFQIASWFRNHDAWHTVGFALLIGFLIYLSLDILEAALLQESPFTVPRMFQFVRGFIAMGTGMWFAWAALRNKDADVARINEECAEELQNRVKDIALLSVIDRRVLLSALWQERQDFLSVISHRLRTPILANQRAAELLKQREFGAINLDQEQMLQHLIDNNQDINRLLDMLIAIYKYKNERMNLIIQPCRLEEVVRSCISKHADRAAMANISLSAAPASDATVQADAEQLSTLVNHLIENAIKHARSRVIVREGMTAEQRAFIEIRDDGRGMAKNDVENLFDRFYLMSAEGKYAPTTGIGLCLCAEITKAHGGQITCQSTVGEGTTFTVWLPVST